MTWEQAVITIAVALIGGASGILVERQRQKREAQKETTASFTVLKQAQLQDDASKRKEIEDAAREIREFLKGEVKELNIAVDRMEVARAGEREKWHQMLGELSTKNLELELQHRKDMARIHELEEEAAVIDDEMKCLKVAVATAASEALILTARLDACKLECDRIRARV